MIKSDRKIKFEQVQIQKRVTIGFRYVLSSVNLYFRNNTEHW